MSSVPAVRRAVTEDLPVYDSAAQPPAWWTEAVELWRYRDLIGQLVARDIKVRYKRSFIGVAWTMLSPLMMTVVFSVAFSHVFRVDSPNYPVFLLSGTLAWGFFSQTTAQAKHQLIGSGPFLTQIYLPRTVFAVSASVVGLVNLILALVPLLLLMVATGAPLTPALAWLPVSILLLAAFTLGLSLLLSAVAAQFYDIVEIYQVVLTAWFFWTPIIYPSSMIPEDQPWRSVSNPMFYLLSLFRDPIYDGRAPDPFALVVAVLIAAVTLAVGWLYFTSRSDQLAFRL